MSLSPAAHDPSAPDYGGISPAKLGRRMKGAPLCECPASSRERKVSEESPQWKP